MTGTAQPHAAQEPSGPVESQADTEMLMAAGTQQVEAGSLMLLQFLSSFCLAQGGHLQTFKMKKPVFQSLLPKQVSGFCH